MTLATEAIRQRISDERRKAYLAAAYKIAQGVVISLWIYVPGVFILRFANEPDWPWRKAAIFVAVVMVIGSAAIGIIICTVFLFWWFGEQATKIERR